MHTCGQLGQHVLVDAASVADGRLKITMQGSGMMSSRSNLNINLQNLVAAAVVGCCYFLVG